MEPPRKNKNDDMLEKKSAWFFTDKPRRQGRCACESDPTYYSDSPYFVHEQRWDDVAGQHRQAPQEADHVDDDVVLLLEVQMAAFLRVEEGGVLHPAVFEFFLPEVCSERRGVKKDTEADWKCVFFPTL